MRLRLLLALAVAITLAVPSVCAARNAVVSVPLPGPFGTSLLTGPRLAGSSIVWGVSDRRGSLEVRRAAATGTVRSVATLPARGVSSHFDLEASKHRVAVSQLSQECNYDCHYSGVHTVVGRVVEGPLSGPLAHLSGCSPDSFPCEAHLECYLQPSIDVWEHAVAAGSTCGAPALVRDHSGGSGPTDSSLPVVYAVRMAGRYVAWPESPPAVSGTTDLVVYDRVADHEAYRLTETVAAFDVQEDGKVAFTKVEQGDGHHAAIAWASQAEPTAHVIGAATGYPEIRMAADRVAVSSAVAPDSRDFRVLTLAGEETAHTVTEAAIGGFDFDGSRLASASRPCADALVLAWDLTKADAPAPPRGACPAATVDQARLAIGKDRRTAVWLRCTSRRSTLGCGGKLRLLARGRQSRAGTPAARYLLASVFYHVQPGNRTRLRLRLGPAATRFLALHRGASVRATSIAFSRAERGLAGTFEVRSRTLTLSR